MTSKGLTLVYNGGLQSGDGIMDWVRRGKNIHDTVKRGKYISKAGDAIDALGLTGFLDTKTGGTYSKARKAAKKAGYGKKKRTTRKKR